MATCTVCGTKTHTPHVVDCDFVYCTRECEQAVHYDLVREFGGSYRPGDQAAYQAAMTRKTNNQAAAAAAKKGLFGSWW